MSLKQAVEQMEMEIAELTKKLAASEANLERIAFMGMDVPMQGDSESFYQMQLRSCISIAANNSRSTLNAMIAKERQAGRDSYQKELSEQEPAAFCQLLNGVYDQVYDEYSDDPDIYALILRPEPPKDKK